jgi:hypothetical protein
MPTKLRAETASRSRSRDFGELPNGLGLRAIAAARKVLAEQTAAGNDPRRSTAVNRARGEAISAGHRRNRSWARFKREITPRIDAFSLKEIAEATGLSLAALAVIPRTR